MIAALRFLNLVLRMLLEIGSLVAFGYWGVQTADGTMAVISAGGAVLLAIGFWGTFVAPKSLVAVSPQLKSLLALTMFVIAAAALVGAGQVLAASIFAAAAWVNVTLTRLLGEPVTIASRRAGAAEQAPMPAAPLRGPGGGKRRRRR